MKPNLATPPADASRYAVTTEYKGISMRLVGHWIDLSAYYLGSDGNMWSWSNGAGYGGNWSNKGPLDGFKPERLRGQFWGLVESEA